jgi:hypothetical protein
MAGPNVQTQIHLSTGVGLPLQTPADKLYWAPVVPTRLLFAVATVTVATTAADNAIIAFDKRITSGSDTGRVELDQLEIAGGAPQGRAAYVNLANAPQLVPGDELVVELLNASVAGTAHIDLWVEQTWETPLNNADMVVSVS